MAAPLAIGAAALQHRRRAPGAMLTVFGLLAVLLVVAIGVLGAIFGLQPAQPGYGPSAAARAEIPAAYLQLYRHAGPATASTPGSSPASVPSRPTMAARPPRACAPASTPTAAAPARCSSRSPANPAPGTTTDSTATTTAT